MTIRQNALGPDHPDVASSLDNLSEILTDQARYDDAEPLCRRALAIEKTLGPDHPDVAASLDGLVQDLEGRDQIDDALAASARAVDILQRHLDGCELGFGAGIAHGYATLGQIGFSVRSGYTAISTVCNLAATVC